MLVFPIDNSMIETIYRLKKEGEKSHPTSSEKVCVGSYYFLIIKPRCTSHCVSEKVISVTHIHSPSSTNAGHRN
uniref:Uncharacterized protein n=1 Tax=Aegilops tauschii subsp. strangulata TaxID=200361 RepID=A0A453JPM7_AEGTS